MPIPFPNIPELHDRCFEWSQALAGRSAEAERIAILQAELQEFVLDRPLIGGILREIAGGALESDPRQRLLFDNEWLLYMDARRRFSLRMYLHGPAEYTMIHDHSSWGILGNASGVMEVVKYRREDAGEKEGYARLAQSESIYCTPGRTDLTRPLNNGIHRVGNPTERTIVVINIYGTPLRRLYINRFDIHKNQVSKVYPPRFRKKMLASEALLEFE